MSTVGQFCDVLTAHQCDRLSRLLRLTVFTATITRGAGRIHWNSAEAASLQLEHAGN